ncbi:MAG TPA: zf-HC2 domain-containing protein [Pirellulaceae bacterium]|nr:zf-HC2 domain-containing protein [Pirellulaceae bacterium]
MSHDPFDERLSAYLDGQLPPAERDEVETLLQQRPELAQVLAQVRQLGEGIRQLPRESLGPKFADRVLATVERTETVPSTPRRSRRHWLVVAAGAIAAIAAAIVAMLALRPGLDDVAQPPALSPAEQAVAAVLDQAREGQAVVVRLRLTKDAIRGKALDQALAAHGIAAAPATAINPAAQESAQAYKSLAQKDQQSGSAADVLFIEADSAKLQKALAEVALSSQGTPVISSGGVVSSTAAGIDRLPKVEGESGTVIEDVKVEGKNYAQHLPPRGFPLLKPAEKATTAQPSARPATNAARPARVLVVVEVIP